MRSAETLADIVVGVGASAGGLEAMLTMFAHARPTRRLVYVVAQHMADGAHSDLVVRLIQREAHLPVLGARDGQALLADHIFIIPAGWHGTVERGAIKLVERGPDEVSTPSIDTLLTSIARDYGAHGVGVLLSGAGWDGARGSRDLIHAGGVVLAQQQTEAAFSSMPDAARASHPAVREVNAGAMAQEIERSYRLASRDLPAPSSTPVGAGPDGVTHLGEQASATDVRDPEGLADVIARIREVTQIDFSEYRPETLLRRLQSRRRVLALDQRDYLALLNSDPQEARRLQQLFLVSLSSFWRDRHCFESLSEALAGTRDSGRADQVFRVWVPGCASGEEVYTLAALLSDLKFKSDRGQPFEIVGTDLNPQALEKAQLGCFESKSFRETPPGWLERWFEAEGNGFKVKPQLKACVRFVLADVEDGPPPGLRPGEVDLISCRNLLIYFHPSKQNRLVSLFSGLIRPGGLLFIGPAEHLGAGRHALFRPLHTESRIYRRTRSPALPSWALGTA